MSKTTRPIIGHLPLARLSRGSVPQRVLASALALSAAMPAVAQTTTDAPISLPPVVVEEQRDSLGAPPASDGYKVDRSASEKFTAPLVDTPKTVTIIPKEVIQEQGAKTLVDVLRTQPGISIGAPEVGNPLGDRFYIRGFDARGDIFIDGMRNAGSTTRETFNVEQIEVVKGPGSAYVGRGSTGGAVNIVTKQARAGNFNEGTVSLGTDMTKRVTVDSNMAVGTTAFRVNGMWQNAEVAGRDEVYNNSWGVAPSLTLGLGRQTRATISYYHLSLDALPDYGVLLDERTGRPATVNRSNYYGFRNRDFRKTETDIGTVDVSHDINDYMTLRNVTRMGVDTQDYVASGPNARNWTTNLLTMQNISRNSDTKSFLNQTDLTTTFSTWSLQHTLNTGIEYARENARQRGYTFTAANGTVQTQNIYNPNTLWYGSLTPASAWWELNSTNQGIYAFDTVKLNDQWEVNGGLRFDIYNARSLSVSATGVPTMLEKGSEFFSYQSGIVYKPLPNGSIYVAYASSANPSGEVLDATAADYGGLAAGNVALDPETSKSYELGTKWDLRNKRLTVSASIFRTDKTNMRVAGPGGTTVQSGEVRVDGIELGIQGYLARGWAVFGGFTHLIPEIVNAGPNNAANNGKQLANVARDAFSLWSTYKIFEDWTVGGGAYYQSQRYGSDNNAFRIPAYWRFDAMVGYEYSKNLNLKLNVANLTNATYYDAIYRSATSYALVAPGRSALLTAQVKF